MTRQRAFHLALVLLAPAAPVLAGTVYVPLPGTATVGEAQWEPIVLVGNSDAEELDFQQLFLAAGTDGTDRDADPAPQALGPGRTTGLLPQPDAAGLLELQGAEPLAFSAKLVRVGQPDSAGVFLPVLSSENLFAADDTVIVQGARRGASTATDWTLVNLGHGTAQCSRKVFAGTGAQAGSTDTVTMPPLSLRTYADFLPTFALTEAANARAEVSCDEPFFSFALIRDEETGEVAFLGPSGKGSSTLGLPGAE